MADYDALRLAEMAAISEYLHELDDEQWDEASLCDGWRVRDVISHMCVGYTTPMPVLLAKIAKTGMGSLNKAEKKWLERASERRRGGG